MLVQTAGSSTRLATIDSGGAPALLVLTFSCHTLPMPAQSEATRLGCTAAIASTLSGGRPAVANLGRLRLTSATASCLSMGSLCSSARVESCASRASSG